MTTNMNALVTGANKGIGLETVRRLGTKGFKVWLGARDAERGEAAAKALRNEGLDPFDVELGGFQNAFGRGRDFRPDAGESGH